MKRLLAIACLSIIGLVPRPGHSAADPAVQVLETDPVSGAALQGREPLYVRIAYDSEIPLRFQAQAYHNGTPVERSAAFNPAPVYPAGRGEAVAWIAFDQYTRIDAVGIRVMNERWQPVLTVTHPVAMEWSGVMPEQWRKPAAWAQRLSDAQQSMVVRAARDYSAEQSDGWGNLLILLMGLSLPGYLILQIWLWLSSRGGWRKAALAPLLLMVPLLLYTLFALLAGSNLWPLMLLFLTPLAFVYLLVLWIARRFAATPAAG